MRPNPSTNEVQSIHSNICNTRYKFNTLTGRARWLLWQRRRWWATSEARLVVVGSSSPGCPWECLDCPVLWSRSRGGGPLVFDDACQVARSVIPRDANLASFLCGSSSELELRCLMWIVWSVLLQPLGLMFFFFFWEFAKLYWSTKINIGIQIGSCDCRRHMCSP